MPDANANPAPHSPAFGGGGFSIILGNPPWERVKLQDQEFFAQRDPAVAGAPNAAARKKAIAALKDTNPALLKEFEDATRRAEGESHLMRSSGRYPLCGRGDINTYAVFAESMRDALGPTGRMGVIVPTGIATDDTTKFFFGDLVQTQTLSSLLSFENEEFIFPGVHHSYCFSLLIVSGRASEQNEMDLVFFARRIEHLAPAAGRRFSLTPEEIVLLNPNTLTCPVFRSERDAEITKVIYRRVPVLIRDARDDQPAHNPWNIVFLRMLDLSNDSGLFVAPEIACPAVKSSLAADAEAQPPYLPLYEAKMIHQFDHRWATYAVADCDWLATPILTKINKEGQLEPDTRDVTAAEQINPAALVAPRYWVKSDEVEARLIKSDKDGNVLWRWERQWLLGWRDISRANNDRTLIATVLPRVGIGNSIALMCPDDHDPKRAACLIACVSTFAYDYTVRAKVGGTHVNYFILKQTAVLPPSAFTAQCPWHAVVKAERRSTLADWITPRVLELVYTAHDLAAFARDLGYDGPPFRWDVARRAQIRAELDAAFFHLYGVSRDDAAYILDNFLVFKARDEERHGGVYKTKETILAIYDDMAKALVATPTIPASLPPTQSQIDRGRAAAYITLLASTWNKPVEREAMEYGLVLMLSDSLRAAVLATRTKVGSTPRSTKGQASLPSGTSSAPGFVKGLDAMLGLLASNNVLRVVTQGTTQRIELGTAGAAAVNALAQSDVVKAKAAVAAFEILRDNLRSLDTFAEAKDLEFSVM